MIKHFKSILFYITHKREKNRISRKIHFTFLFYFSDISSCKTILLVWSFQACLSSHNSSKLTKTSKWFYWFHKSLLSRYVAQIPSPANIQEIGFFINPQYQSPENGSIDFIWFVSLSLWWIVVLYCNFPNSNEWELLGTVTQNCPTYSLFSQWLSVVFISTIFRTGWATKGISNCPYVTLGVSFESYLLLITNNRSSSAFALNIKDAVPNDATKEIPAFKVAQDCYNYCLSFAQIKYILPLLFLWF